MARRLTFEIRLRRVLYGDCFDFCCYLVLFWSRSWPIPRYRPWFCASFDSRSTWFAISLVVDGPVTVWMGHRCPWNTLERFLLNVGFSSLLGLRSIKVLFAHSRPKTPRSTKQPVLYILSLMVALLAFTRAATKDISFWCNFSAKRISGTRGCWPKLRENAVCIIYWVFFKFTAFSAIVVVERVYRALRWGPSLQLALPRLWLAFFPSSIRRRPLTCFWALL